MDGGFGGSSAVAGEVQGGNNALGGASGVVNGKDHSSGWQLGFFGTLAFHLGV